MPILRLSLCLRHARKLALSLLAAAPLLGQTAPKALPKDAGPDPREIPVPEISTGQAAFPGASELPRRQELPDIMVMNDLSRVSTPDQWQKRRQEMKAILAYYAVGRAPPPPGNVTGHETATQSLADGHVKYRLVHLAFGPGEKLGLDIAIFTPAEGGPFPPIILQGGPTPGAKVLPRLPQGPTQGKGADVLLVAGHAPISSGAGAPPAVAGGFFGQLTPADAAKRYSDILQRGFALVMVNPNDCAEDTTLREADGSWSFRTTRFAPAYGGFDWGILRIWAWGVSRVADYLETDPAIDHSRLPVVTGASRYGKSSMVAAAFDDRLMGAPVVTGGGGIGAYRYAGDNHSETLDIMMKKYPNWFSPHLHEFWGQREKLPFDEHWFLALCAPRPFIALEGTADVISSPVAVRHSIEGARPAYELLGAGDRIAVNYANHAHAFTPDDWTALMDFAGRHNSAAYNVRTFGATGDGTTKDTAAFQKALDTCAVNGGGEVIVPAGHYLIGSVQLGQCTILRLEAGSTIVGSGDLADYPMIDVRWEGRWQPGHRALIYATEVSQVGIVGSGLIEGNPTVAAPQNPRGSVVLEFVSCQDVRWEGFSVHQGGNWATHPTYCANLLIRGLNIVGKRDGIDVDSCEHVRIENCVIDTGDDSISLKSGRGLDGARIAKPTEDVQITGCTMTGRRFACIGIGSETSGGIRDVRIEHCIFLSARTDAIYIKTRIGRGGVIENISGDDLEVKEGSFLRINLISSGNRNTADDAVPGLIGYPLGRNFSFSHIRLKAKTLAEVSEVSAEKPLEGLVLSQITGTCSEGIRLANVKGASISGVQVTGCAGPLLSIRNVTGAGLDGAAPLAAALRK